MHVARSTLDRETDARFWAQTGYRVGRRLNPHDPADQQMIPVWLDVARKVAAEDEAGRLQLTYNHPAVEDGLSDAEIASHAQAGHLAAAATTDDPSVAQDHLRAASDAQDAHVQATRRAADVQPPTASPFLADQAAAWVAQILGEAHAPVDDRLPADHPAREAQDAAPRPGPSPVAVAPPPMLPDPGTASASLATSPAHQAADDQVALAQARSAPDAAALTHERGRRGHGRRGRRHHQGGHRVPGRMTAPAGTATQVREVAAGLAARYPGPYSGTVYAGGNWQFVTLASRSEADAWYSQVTDHPDTFLYAATWDRTDPRWPSPASEVFGSSRGVEAEVTSPEAPARGFVVSTGTLVAVGAVLVGGALVALAGRRGEG